MAHLYRNPECADDTNESLELIPKRVNGPVPNTEHEGWGLQAVEGPNGLLIATVGLSFLALAIWFLFWWLRKHTDDMQSAAILLLLILQTIGIVVAIPRYMWARVWDREEGRGMGY